MGRALGGYMFEFEQGRIGNVDVGSPKNEYTFVFYMAFSLVDFSPSPNLPQCHMQPSILRLGNLWIRPQFIPVTRPGYTLVARNLMDSPDYTHCQI